MEPPVFNFFSSGHHMSFSYVIVLVWKSKSKPSRLGAMSILSYILTATTQVALTLTKKLKPTARG